MCIFSVKGSPKVKSLDFRSILIFNAVACSTSKTSIWAGINYFIKFAALRIVDG